MLEGPWPCISFILCALTMHEVDNRILFQAFCIGVAGPDRTRLDHGSDHSSDHGSDQEKNSELKIYKFI